MKDYMRFEASVVPLYSKSAEDLWFPYNNGKLAVKSKGDEISILRRKDLEEFDFKLAHTQCMGALDGYNCFSSEIKDNFKTPSGIEIYDLKPLTFLLEEELFLLAAKSLLLLNWEKCHRYCGVCGYYMERKNNESERALFCPKCGYTTWPKTSPAIIVAITKGDQILLAHNKYFPKGMYSVIAGFVELGETFEQCVRREVYEEVGIRVKNIKYSGSQPWPFPNSMMIGFTAEYLDGEINVDGEEIVHADWFSKDEIPKYKKSKSIGAELIEWFKRTH